MKAFSPWSSTAKKPSRVINTNMTPREKASTHRRNREVLQIKSIKSRTLRPGTKDPRNSTITLRILLKDTRLAVSSCGNLIKKEQRREMKVRHDAACSRLAGENIPRKFFQSVKSLTCTEEGGTTRTKTIRDEWGNLARTTKERVDLFANRLEQVH